MHVAPAPHVALIFCTAKWTPKAKTTLRTAEKTRILLPVKGRTTGQRGARHGDGYDGRGNNRVVLESLGSACSRPDRHDGDFQPAICVDAVHGPAQSEARHYARRIAVDL